MGKILIKNGRFWDGKRFSESDILINGEKVAEIRPHITDPADYTFGAAGKIVSAGLVDVHVHMRVTPTDAFGIQAEMSCLPFGVTAVADAGRSQGDPTVIDSFLLKNVLFVNAEFRDNRPELEKVEQAMVRYGGKVVGIKVYFDTELSEIRDITALARVCEFAKDRSMRVMVHCSNSPVPMAEILDTLSEGDILTHAFHGGRNNASEDGFAAMKAAQKRGMIIDTGFAGFVHTDFDVFRKAIEAGVVPDTISTDITKFSAYTRGGRYGMTMCMSMARHMGMREEDIFKAATSNPARALGKAGEWGCLKVGGAADVAVLDYGNEGFSMTDRAGHQITDKNGYRCKLTLINGQIVYKD